MSIVKVTINCKKFIKRVKTFCIILVENLKIHENIFPKTRKLRKYFLQIKCSFWILKNRIPILPIQLSGMRTKF